uniref:Uncharacterized protein n=1 Tax=Cyanistes caeruleus TaxID=156563 RepID=A0A8C0UT60_CYACU
MLVVCFCCFVWFGFSFIILFLNSLFSCLKKVLTSAGPHTCWVQQLSKKLHLNNSGNCFLCRSRSASYRRSRSVSPRRSRSVSPRRSRSGSLKRSREPEAGYTPVAFSSICDPQATTEMLTVDSFPFSRSPSGSPQRSASPERMD